MANRVLSIEIGQSITRVVEMDYMAKNPKIYSCFSFETPENFIVEGKVKPSEVFLAQLRSGFKENKIKTVRTVFTISSGKIANRDITIPLVKENKIASLLMSNSNEYFPVDLTQYQLVHRIVEKIDTKEAKHYRLKVLAVPNDLIESYENLAKFCGLILIALDYAGNSVVQVMQKCRFEEGTVVIKIDENNSMITILKQGRVDLQRIINHGINEAIETLRESEVYGSKLSYSDAMNVMRRKTCIRKHLDTEAGYKEEEDTENTIMNIRIQITESLRMMISNIGRVIDYYISTSSSADINRIELIGIGADCSGLSRLMTNELGIKVTSLQKLSDTNLNKSIDATSFKVAEFVTCIGAAINPMDFVLGEKMTAVKNATEKKESLALAGLVFTGCILVTTGMLVFCFGTNFGLRSENQALQNRIDQLEPAQEIYNTYMGVKSEYSGGSQIEALVQTPNDRILDFLREMETNMPTDIIVNNLSANADGINLNLTVSSKEAAAQTMVQFRSFHSIASATTTGIREDTDEFGSKKVTLSVSCTFVSNTKAQNNATDSAVSTEN